VLELPVVSKEEKRRPSKPSWLKIDLPTGSNYTKVKKIVKENRLHTICEDGRCPNMGECWGAGTATFMILGNVCTRSCSFCAVATGRPGTYDVDEPFRVAEAVRLMGVKHCVITSVNRDELPDKGATVWAATIREVKKQNPETTIETLIPDFKAQWDLLYMKGPMWFHTTWKPLNACTGLCALRPNTAEVWSRFYEPKSTDFAPKAEP
jgi:lipoic acid synthetase